MTGSEKSGPADDGLEQADRLVTGAQRVAAVVVTHNRPEAAVARCAGFRQQTRQPDLVLIVDNGATDETARALAPFPEAEVIRLPANLGPAGGFAAGFARALELGADLLWAMDDDLEPDDDCLRALLAQPPRSKPQVVLATRHSEAGPSHLNRGWYGCLIPAGVVRAIGLPRADFFWWAEDVEYFIRARDSGFPVVTSPTAIVWHRLLRAARDYPAWKLYYEARNTLYYRLHIRGSRLMSAKSLAKIILRGVVVVARGRDRGRKASMIVRGVRDGLAGRLGKTVDPLAPSL